MDPIDFSKINFKKPTGDDSKQAPNAAVTKDVESQVTSSSLPQAGINFKKLNFGKPSGESNSTQSPARTSPAASKPEASQASRRDEELRSTKKPLATTNELPENVVNATNANSTLVGESTTNGTRTSTNATNASGTTNSDSSRAGNVSSGDSAKSTTNAKNESRSFFTNANGVDATTNSNSVDDSVVENPFLDDDDETDFEVSEISLGRSRDSSYDSGPDEVEPFLGFDEAFKSSSSKANSSSSKSGSTSGSENVSESTNATTNESTTNANSRTVSDPVASSRVSDSGDSGDGFDDLLDDLLGDDEYVASSDSVSGIDKFDSESTPGDSESTNATNASTRSNGSSRSTTNGDFVSGGGSNSFVGGRSSDVADALDRVKKNSSDDIELDSRTVSDLELRHKKNREAQELREANREPVLKKVPKRARLESEFVKQAPVEVLVDENGRALGKLSDAVEESTTNANGVTSSSTNKVEKQRYRYVRPDGRLNGAELEFFKNAQVTKKDVLSNPNEMARLRGPLDRNESEVERRERQKHIVRAAAGRNGMQRGKQPRFGQKEREVLEFLAMFRYATDRQLARMFSESQGTAYNRLKRLRQQGLVIDKKIYGNRPIWFLTDAGLVISGYDLPRVTESKLTFSMFPHQFTVNNTAANLWGANVNVLHQEDYPSRNRSNSRDEKVYGENLVSELEIQSSFGKAKGFEKADVYRPQLLANIEREFRDWKRAGGVEFGPSPEMIYGNEYMWSLMPPFNVHLAYHVPDLVIKRPRNADGSPNSIAVEIEISNKPADSYEKTLYAYKSDNRLYKKVIWVCKNAGPARKLETIAKEIGLWQDGRIDIVPVITEDGVFKERDLWTI